jgi:radical SAM protein with 4Fe4S-binding SPASM domain
MAAKKIETKFGRDELVAALIERASLPMTRLEIAITNSCTLACDYCTEINLGRATIPKERVFALVDEASDLGTEVISLTGGEITILDYLPELVAYIKEKGLGVKVTTNGYGSNASNADYVRELVATGLDQLTLSYYSIDSELYDKVTRRKDVKREVERLMRVLQGLKLEGYSFFWNVNTLVDKLNYEELPEKLQLFAGFSGIDRAVPLVVKRRPERFLSREDIDRYYLEVLPRIEAKGLDGRFPIMYREARRLFGVTDEEKQRAAEGLYWVVDAERCYHNFNSLFVASDGNAYHCFTFHVHQGKPLGNIHTLSLKEIWARHQMLVKTFNPSQDPICQAHRCNPDITAYNHLIHTDLRGENDRS